MNSLHDSNTLFFLYGRGVKKELDHILYINPFSCMYLHVCGSTEGVNTYVKSRNSIQLKFMKYLYVLFIQVHIMFAYDCHSCVGMCYLLTCESPSTWNHSQKI